MATRFAFVDDSGETRLAGFLVPEPGGSQPVTTEEAALAGTNIVGGSGAALVWTHFQGDANLDYSVPTAPTVVEAGTYCFTIGLKGPTGGIAFTGELDYGPAMMWSTLVSTWDLSLVVGDETNKPGLGVSYTVYLAAGAAFAAFLDHSDSGEQHSFTGSVIVQRLSGPAT